MARVPDETTLRALLRLDASPEPTPSRHADAARYLSSLEGFNLKRPPISAHVFLPERDRAFARETPTGLIPLDLGPIVGGDTTATVPLILARYARIRAGESLATEFRASAELYYVVQGRGATRFGPDGADRIDWAAGDAFALPGGATAHHRADGADAVLWVVTNEPQLAFERLEPPRPGHAAIRPAHYPAAEIRRHLFAVHRDPRGAKMPGKSVNFGNAGIETAHTTTPTFTLAMNSLLPGEAQRAHRHNAVAVTLVVQGEGCYSLIDGKRVDWEPHATTITPPGTLHSHHNAGRDLALFLIVQDGGLYYHCRTMGFRYR